MNYCKCKNTYLVKCPKKCKAPDYWKQGIGALDGGVISNVDNTNKQRLLSNPEFEDAQFWLDRLDTLDADIYMNLINPITEGDNLLYGNGDEYMRLTNDVSSSKSATLNWEEMQYLSFYTRYKFGETTEGTVSLWVFGKKLFFYPSTQLFTNGEQTVTSGDATGTIETLDTVDGYLWYKMTWENTEVKPAISGRWLVEDEGDFEVFWTSVY